MFTMKAEKNFKYMFFICKQVAKGLTLKNGLKVKQLAKQPPTLKTLIQQNLLDSE